MKNKHTLANKKKFIDKVEQQLKDNIQKQEEQFFSDTHDIIAARGFGKSQIVFNNVTLTLKWWQKLLNKITFGLYKPTTFWYKIKPVKK